MIPSIGLKQGITMSASPPKKLTVSCNQVGKWLLIIGPRSIRYIIMNVIAGIAEQENVNVLDGGNSPETGDGQFDPYQVGWLLRDKPEAYARINLAQAANCHQVLALLEQTPSMPVPFVVLDLLNTFYDHSVKIGERKRLLQGCLENMNRLEKCAGMPADQV